MRVEHLASNASPDEVQAILSRDGCCVIDSRLDEHVLADLSSELAPHIANTEYGTNDFAGFKTRRTGCLVGRSKTCREVIMDPLILGTADQALSHATNYQLHCTQVISIGGGSAPQVIHRDQWAFDRFDFPSGFDSTFSTMWALTDFTEENGATRVVPGSHKLANDLSYGIEDSVAAEMKAGSVLIYTGSLYHGGGENRTSLDRIGMIIHYSLAWLRQEENQYLGLSAEVAAELPEDLLRLMGYDYGAPSLGYMDAYRDPIAAVRPDLETY